MCGTFGIITDHEQILGPTLIDAASRLAYRGYDSVGAATIAAGGASDLRKGVGRVEGISSEPGFAEMRGSRGIAQLRWATFGEPTYVNAQPHFDSDGDMVGAHNGNVVNNVQMRELFIIRKSLMRTAKGCSPVSSSTGRCPRPATATRCCSSLPRAMK